jgi:hypothetical protein
MEITNLRSAGRGLQIRTSGGGQRKGVFLGYSY